MQLKEIEIKGFKSFANKIKLNITSGITVIVGPNGCGKSNITDAVRWILGEQNIRSLRGNNLSDMIFSGNKEQKTKNVAEVSILFDNSNRKLPIDTEEVELKRVVYRSGETENYINGLSCKLRDIHELFWGTGLGRNSYSIIAQGKVDFVLNAKPSERRILFEEASNVSSYHNKKEAAIKKLEAVENNLLRTDDILTEVKENMSYYQKKVDDLKSYRFYQKHIRKLDFYILSQQFLLFQRNIKKYGQILSHLGHEIEKIDELIVQSKKRIIDKEKEKERLAVQMKEEENHFQVIENEKQHIHHQLIILKQKKLEISQRMKTLQEDAEQAKRQFNKFRETIHHIDKEIQETHQHSQKIMQEYQEKKIILEKYKNILSYYEKQNLLNLKEENRGSSHNHLNIINQFRKKKIEEETVKKSISLSLIKTHKEKDCLHAELLQSRKNLEDLKKNVYCYQKEKTDLKEEKIQIDELVAKNNLFIDKQTALIQNIHNDIVLKNKEKDFLDELVKNMGDQKNHPDKNSFKFKDCTDTKYLGVIADLMQYIPKKFKKLFYFLLQGKSHLIEINQSNSIVTLNQYLNENNLGQANIIARDIISSMKSRRFKRMNIKFPKNRQKVFGFAHQMISCPSEYRDLFEILLGHIVVVEDIENAIKLAKQMKGEWIIASLDGMIVDHHGLITLNSGSENNIPHNVYLPIERTEQLKNDIQYLMNEKTKHQTLLDKRKEDNQKNNHRIEYIDSQLEDCTFKLHEEENHFLIMDKKIVDIQNQLEIFNHQLKEDEEKRRFLEKNIPFWQERIERFEQYFHSFHSYSQLIVRLNKLGNHMSDEIKKELNHLKMKFNWNKDKENLLDKQKEEMNHFIQTYHQEEKQRKEKLWVYKKEESELTEQGDRLKKTLKDIMEEIKRLNEEKKKNMNFLNNLEKIIKATRETLEENQDKLEEKKNRFHENEMHRVQNQEKNNHLLNTIKNQYNTSINEILLHQKEAKNQKEASQFITEYKEKISLMGQINFDALQEYQKQSSRYHELENKREEIVKSKAKLVHFIHEIDRIAEEHFYQTFLRVENHFNDIFKRLFRGGQISLKLSNDKNLLETGIEIMVQPPGKKLQNMSLLSTGEKALTAIALLFALWKTNPSPFCFFDEIDSALDEANALRLASFLNNEDFKNSQILIITHQKEIMEAADALYGITMEGSGVSKLISVKMLDKGA